MTKGGKNKQTNGGFGLLSPDHLLERPSSIRRLGGTSTSPSSSSRGGEEVFWFVATVALGASFFLSLYSPTIRIFFSFFSPDHFQVDQRGFGISKWACFFSLSRTAAKICLASSPRLFSLPLSLLHKLTENSFFPSQPNLFSFFLPWI